MATYVCSLRGGSRTAHIGTDSGTTLCAAGIYTAYVTTAEVLPGRTLCVRCAVRHDRHVALAVQDTNAVAERDALIVALLRDGLDNGGIARRLHIGSRTVTRWVNDAMTRAGARSRFQWGYKVGYDEGRRAS